MRLRSDQKTRSRWQINAPPDYASFQVTSYIWKCMFWNGRWILWYFWIWSGRGISLNWSRCVFPGFPQISENACLQINLAFSDLFVSGWGWVIFPMAPGRYFLVCLEFLKMYFFKWTLHSGMLSHLKGGTYFPSKAEDWHQMTRLRSDQKTRSRWQINAPLRIVFKKRGGRRPSIQSWREASDDETRLGAEHKNPLTTQCSSRVVLKKRDGRRPPIQS